MAQTGGTADDIAAQEALVEAAQANVKNLQAQISQTFIRAPFIGVVTQVDAKVGQIAPINTALVSIISKDKFQVELYVPEIDVAKVAIGNAAQITLDAYGSTVIFNAALIAIDPAETILNGASSYKVTLQFSDIDSRLKPGMTVNATVIADKRTAVLAVPQQAIITRGDQKFVLKAAANGESVLTPVITGIKSTDGLIEITQGLEEGDRIIGFGNASL